MAVRQSLRPATGGQVRVVCQYLPYRDARLVLTAEAPERSHKNRLRGQPAWLLDQDARGDVSCGHKITEMKPCPRLVHHRLLRLSGLSRCACCSYCAAFRKSPA